MRSPSSPPEHSLAGVTRAVPSRRPDSWPSFPDEAPPAHPAEGTGCQTCSIYAMVKGRSFDHRSACPLVALGPGRNPSLERLAGPEIRDQSEFWVNPSFWGDKSGVSALSSAFF